MTWAVGFDLGDTLIEYAGLPLSWEHEYPVALAAVASLWGERVSDLQISRGTTVLRRFNTRQTPRTLEIDHTVVFTELLGALGAPSEQASSLVERAADAFFAVFQRRSRPFPEANGAISALIGQGVSVGVLTDVPYGMPRRLVLADIRAAGLEVLEQALITSVEVGTRKPDPHGFVSLAAHLGCASERMVFVGNEEKDVVGATAAGMCAVLVWREDGAVPAWGQQHSVRGVDEVVRLLATF